MRITLAETKATASIARLHFSEPELVQMNAHLEHLLEYAEKLKEINIHAVEPTTHAVPMSCPFRDDKMEPHFSVQTALQNAPRAEAGFFVVPGILHMEGE